MIEELDLPVCDIPQAEPPRLTQAEYDKWVNENLRTLQDTTQRQRLGSQLSRRPVAVAFRIEDSRARPGIRN